MSNIVTFKPRTFNVLFNLPDEKIIHMIKRGSDEVAIQIDGEHGTATLKATTKHAAEKKIKSIFPTCIIIDVIINETT
jgi:hypothetical protein